MKVKSSPLVTILGLFIFIGSVGFIIGIVQASPQLYPAPWSSWATILISFSYLISALWLWSMEKRGLELYILITILVDILGLATGYKNVPAYILPILFIILLSGQYKKMHNPRLFKR
ncbi:MAG: hypothetical protein V4576_03095 [Patescibacteria group bacterium]